LHSALILVASNLKQNVFTPGLIAFGFAHPDHLSMHMGGNENHLSIKFIGQLFEIIPNIAREKKSVGFV